MKSKKEKTKLDFEVGARCQIARLSAGYTQQQLAELIDVSVQYLSDMERGKTGMSTTTVVRLCKALNVSADFILLGKRSPDEINDAEWIQQQIEYLDEKERLLIKTIISFLLSSK